MCMHVCMSIHTHARKHIHMCIRAVCTLTAKYLFLPILLSTVSGRLPCKLSFPVCLDLDGLRIRIACSSPWRLFIGEMPDALFHRHSGGRGNLWKYCVCHSGKTVYLFLSYQMLIFFHPNHNQKKIY